MAQIILPPKVQEFRDFIKDHPKLFEKLRQEKYSWQELYDIWDQDGDKASIFVQYQEDEEEVSQKTTKKLNWQDLLNRLSEVDVEKVEKHVQQLSRTLEKIQRLSNQSNTHQPPEPRRLPPWSDTPFHGN